MGCPTEKLWDSVGKLLPITTRVDFGGKNNGRTKHFSGWNGFVPEFAGYLQNDLSPGWTADSYA
jgi:hypothetical protein